MHHSYGDPTIGTVRPLIVISCASLEQDLDGLARNNHNIHTVWGRFPGSVIYNISLIDGYNGQDGYFPC